nr:HlyD family secretion protein [Saprospiraceae bacterium]
TANNLISATGGVNLTTDQVTNFIVTIDIDQSSYKDLIKPGKPYPFRPGMSASVEIFTNTKDGVVSVPIQAVGTRDKEDAKSEPKAAKVNEEEGASEITGMDDLLEVVFVVMPGDSVSQRTVKTGIQDNDYIEILEGLKAGEEVVIGPYTAVSRKLESGSKIQVETKDEKDKKKKKAKEDEEKVEVEVD